MGAAPDLWSYHAARSPAPATSAEPSVRGLPNVVAHLRLFRSCVWLYILVRLLLLVVPSVSSSPPSVLRRYLAHKIQDTCPGASLICIFPRRRAGPVVVGRGDGCGCWSRSLGGRRAETRRHVPLGCGGEASGTRSLRSRGDCDCDYGGPGGRPKIFPRGTFPGRHPQPPGLARQL